MSMPNVTKVELSANAGQAVVSLSNGDRHSFLVSDVEKGSGEIARDAASGSLAVYLSFYEGDTQEELAETFAAGDDWTSIYEAQA